MWLDRLAVQPFPGPSSSQSTSRAASPLPRRTSSIRGPYTTSSRSARSSSLSLASSNSSTSLLASARRTNGSALKQTTTVDDGKHAAEVLQKLLGEDLTLEEKLPAPVTEEDLELDFDFGGHSLSELVSEPLQAGDDDLYRPQTIEEYERDKTKFEELSKSIRACDDVLSSVETNLTSFRNDLANVSADIESLQARSTALNVRLDNRKAVEKGLAPIVEEVSVSPVIVAKIAEGHIDEEWVQALKQVEKRALAHKNSANQGKSKALADLGPLLERLVLKAIERIRDFLVAQIKALRSPNINAQIIQQHNFLRFKELFAFLHKHHAILAEEICQAYKNTMKWYYLTQFTRYQKALEKLKLHVLDKTDVLGHDDSSRKTTVLSSAKISGPPHDAFNLGRRLDILRTGNQQALSSYLAEEDQTTHYLEVPFRNFNLALVDNASAEYTFLTQFFTPALPVTSISRHFGEIFESTFALGRNLSKSLIDNSFDCLGLLICIRLNQRLAFELQRRRIPAADGYINGTSMVLWPRLQMVMSHHCDSVRTLTSALPTRQPAASAVAQQSAAPHVVTQRFGQLLHGLLVLSTDAGDDEPLMASLGRLRSETEAFLTRFSQVWFGKDKRKRERFLYNNYSLILTIIGDSEGKLADEQKEHFENLKKAFQEGA
ncbi:hypothetical protein MCOR25_004646 [Pyricularia grisea]|uniref:Uncharacterized protein n=1 Tax=Pyricularia grisea TaxID=148305 RepID=A0A6P8BMF4_PYRGI|nr:uncharacterized protein PgNI_01864 [Pyricularia grisea]KAI6368349.1 hypothetical protein MCOR25_004646 [Pyricularia grisea]TLD17722.1 hypothetical protein PgNI_01864 [Pyricularia grisea]